MKIMMIEKVKKMLQLDPVNGVFVFVKKNLSREKYSRPCHLYLPKELMLDHLIGFVLGQQGVL